jgi:hypothetical protein
MTGDEHSIGRAAALRDAAGARTRRTTATVIALAAGLTAVFTAVAASSTHPRRHLTTLPQAPLTRQPPVRAPVPALVPVAHPGARRDRPAPTPAPAQTQAPAQAQAPAPAPVAAPPVVSSGGS